MVDKGGGVQSKLVGVLPYIWFQAQLVQRIVCMLRACPLYMSEAYDFFSYTIYVKYVYICFTLNMFS